MLTPTPTARSFSEFLLGRTSAPADDNVHAQQAPRSETSDHLSYFDAIMRQRSRRPLSRRRLRSHN